jgi:hypothetical protein
MRISAGRHTYRAFFRARVAALFFATVVRPLFPKDLADWDTYFAEQRVTLEQAIEQLEAELAEHE